MGPMKVDAITIASDKYTLHLTIQKYIFKVLNANKITKSYYVVHGILLRVPLVTNKSTIRVHSAISSAHSTSRRERTKNYLELDREKQRKKILLRHILIQVFPVKIVITTLKKQDEISLCIRLNQFSRINRNCNRHYSLQIAFIRRKETLDLFRSITITLTNHGNPTKESIKHKNVTTRRGTLWKQKVSS